MSGPARAEHDGIEIAVRVTPRSTRPGIGAVTTDAAGDAWLQLRVGEPAEDGRATRAAAALLARHLGVAPGRVRLRAGAAARNKRFLVEGEPAALLARLTGTP